MKSTGNFTVERPPTFLGTLARFPPLCTDSPLLEGTRDAIRSFMHAFIHSTVMTKTNTESFSS